MNWPLRWSIQLIITSKPDSAELQRAHTFQTSIRGNNTLYLVFCAIAFWRSYTNLHADTSIWNTFCFPGTAIHISFFMVETIKVRQDAVQRTNASVIVRVILIDSLAYYDYVTQHSLKSCAVLIHRQEYLFSTRTRSPFSQVALRRFYGPSEFSDVQPQPRAEGRRGYHM